MIHLDDLMRWYIGTRKAYDKIPPSEIDPNGCYFILDTREVILEGINYEGILVFFSGPLPSHPSKQRLYMSLDNFEVYAWPGYWVRIYSHANSEAITQDPDGDVTHHAVSGEVVEDYARRLVEYTVLDNAKFYDMSYDSNTNSLHVHIGDYYNKNITIARIGNRLIKDDERILLLDANNEVISYFTPYPRHVIGGKFNSATGTIDFQFGAGPPLQVQASGMMNLLYANTTKTIYATNTSDRGLAFTIKISNESDNLLEERLDGVFMSYANYMDMLQPGFKGLILVSDADGNRTLVPNAISTKQIPYGSLSRNVVIEEVVWDAVKNIHKIYTPKTVLYPNLDGKIYPKIFKVQTIK